MSSHCGSEQKHGFQFCWCFIRLRAGGAVSPTGVDKHMSDVGPKLSTCMHKSGNFRLCNCTCCGAVGRYKTGCSCNGGGSHNCKNLPALRDVFIEWRQTVREKRNAQVPAQAHDLKCEYRTTTTTTTTTTTEITEMYHPANRAPSTTTTNRTIRSNIFGGA